MSKSAQTPSVGRIVLYYPPNNARDPRRPRAAIITRVWQDSEHSLVNLETFGDDMDPVNDDGERFCDLDPAESEINPLPTSVPHDDSKAPLAFTWAWPPRVS